MTLGQVILSVRYRIPLLLFIFTLVLLNYTAIREQATAAAVVRGEFVSDLMKRLTLIQARVHQIAVTTSDFERIGNDAQLLIALAQPSQLLIVNRAMTVVISTFPQWVGRPLKDLEPLLIHDVRADRLGAVIERLDNKGHGEIAVANTGNEVLAVYPLYAPAPIASDAALSVGYIIVKADLNGKLRQISKMVAQHLWETTAMVTGLAIVLGFMLHFSVTRRLGRLVQITEEFASGNLNVRAGTQTGDEVGKLAVAFDSMANQIEQTQRLLEYRVQLRTEELAKTVYKLENEVQERKTAELILVNEKEKIRVTLASIGDGVITTDNNGHVTFINRSAEQLIGWPQDEALNSSLATVFKNFEDSPNGTENDREFSVRAVRTDNASDTSGTVRLTTRLGQTKSIDYSASPICDQDGRRIGSVLILRDVTDALVAAEQLQYQASHDALTGLVNRREFERRLKALLQEQASGGHAVIYLDMDQFKIVNDTCGHNAGDELLRQVSCLLVSHMRKGDTLARLGGDEFGGLLKFCDCDDALNVAQKMLAALQCFRFFWEGRAFGAGASIGVVPINASVDTLESIFKAADDACYVAKEQGRNRVHLYQPDDRNLAERQQEMQWVPRISYALLHDQFRLYYQPVHAIGSRSMQRGEILLRLVDRDHRTVLPSTFIPAAERYHQMQEIDRWVIEHVFLFMKASAIRRGEVAFSINLSGQSLGDARFLEYVEQQIEHHQVTLNNVCFEITETAVISNLVHAQRFLSALKPRGCHFALDDFGSGLSSFGYLKTLSVDYLKIDGKFVKDMHNDSIDRAMVEAIHRIGRVMGIETIAEAVENAETLAMLKDIGVDYAQGFAVGAPMPLTDVFKAGDEIFLT